MNGRISKFGLYNTAPTLSEIHQLYTQHTGTAARTLPNGTWTPVVDGEANLPVDSTVDSVQVVNTEETATSDVTISALVTDNVTLTSETLTGNDYAASLSHVVSENVTSGTISFTPTLLSQVGLPALTGTNTNATFAYLPNTFEIETGILSKGDTDTYNVSGDTDTYNVSGELFNISGYVNDSVSGDGIPNATIHLTGDSIATSVYSNASGYYLIGELYNGSYTITASKTGYISNSVDIVISGADNTTDELLLEEIGKPTMVNVTNVPISIYAIIVLFGLITGAYAILRKDNEYYTHMIACIISSLLFGTSSYISFAGVTGEGWSDGAAMPIMTLYTLPSLGYLFAGVAAILIFYFLMRMYDIYQENADAGWMKQ